MAGPAPAKRAWTRLVGVGVIVVLIVGLVALVRFGPETSPGRRFIEREASGLAFGSLGRLSVIGLSGDPWSRFGAARVTLTDARGVWLDARGLDVAWRPSELFERRARLTSLVINNLALVHPPKLGGGGESRPLPVSVTIDAARARIEMTPEFAVRRGVYDLTGALDLERSGVVRGQLAAESVLHPGDHLTAQIDVQRSKAFRIDADAREAQGGALAGSLGLAADQPFLLTAHAAGDKSQGQVFIDTHLGASSPLQVRSAWNKQGGQAQGRIELTASSLLAGYKSMVGPFLSFNVTGRRAADGFDDLILAASSENLSLNAAGEANIGALAAGPRGLAVDLRVVDLNRIFHFPSMGPASLAGRVTGDHKHWVLAGSAAIDKVADGPFSLARVTGPVRLENQGRDLLIQADPVGEGGAGRGLLAALLGARPRGSAQITRFADGRLLMRKLSLDGAGLKATASGDKGLFGDLSFKGQANFANLAMAHVGARGVVNMDWTARQASGVAPWAFTVDAHGANFGSGFAEADRLLGDRPRLETQARYAGGVVTVSSATLTGAAGQANGVGTLGGDGAIALKLDWQAKGPFDVGPIEVDGAAKGTGDIAGTLSSPRADLVADFTTIDAAGFPLHDAHLTLTFQHGPTGGDGKFHLAAASAYGPAEAASGFTFAGDGLDLTDLAVKAGGVTAAGSLALRRGEPSSADLTLVVVPGALLSQGHVEGSAKIVAGSRGATADISLKAAEAVLKDGGPAVKNLDLTANGPLDHLPYTLAANGPSPSGPWRIRGYGVFSREGLGRVATFSGTGRVRQADVRTLSPAELHLAEHGITFRAALGAGQGRADVQIANQAGEASVKATLSDLDMALLDEDYIGKFSGQLTLAGRGEHLSGDLQARLSGAGGRDLRGAPPVSGEVNAKLAGNAVTMDFNLGNAKGLTARGRAVLPAVASAAPLQFAFDSHRPISGSYAIDGELKPLWDLAIGRGDNTLSGQVNAAGTLSGTLADPRAVGQVALDNGRFQDEDTGLLLQNVTLRANLVGAAVDVSEFTAVDGAKGRISGQGRASLQRDGVSSFRADLVGFKLIDTDFAHATASGQMSVNRAADGKVKLTGALTIDRAQISPNPPLAGGVTPMDVVEIHRRDELDDTVQPPASAHEAPVALDMSIRAPGGVFLKGRGLNLELSLNAHVGGTVASPLLTGTSRVVRGDYDFAGQRFQMDDRSVIYLGSTPQTIRLDLTATREDPGLTAVIRIAGTAAKPTINLSSSPALPQDEILSQVLFGASAAQLSGLEAAQLASAVAGLHGAGGFDLIGGLRSLAHLDRLAIADTAVNGASVSGGKYITDKLYLQLTGGGREGQGAQIEWRVRKRLSLVGKLGSQGDSQIAIRWRRSY